MPIDFDKINLYLPYYLAAESRRVLAENLDAIKNGGTGNYFSGSLDISFGEEMLQGDGWSGFERFDHKSGSARTVNGIVLSNSCDIDPSNPRDVPTRITFAPLIKLSNYEVMLRRQSDDTSRINNKLDSIRQQAITSIFFLPASGSLAVDHVIFFDDIHSMPTSMHKKSLGSQKLFTLSDFGFYMLVFKLSVHFCRLQEKVSRNGEPPY